MFGFGKKEDTGHEPAWLAEMNEIRQRWFVFLEKLETRMDELGEAALPDLREAFNQADDPYKQLHSRMLSGIKGQLEQMRDKARKTEEEKIDAFYDRWEDDVDFGGAWHDQLSQFRDDTGDRFRRFEERIESWRQKLDATAEQDLEIEYQKLLDEYEQIKDKFHCKQCGGNIRIEKMFFIATYITCPYCQTQNTFEPSSQARGLEHLGRSLAEQRCAHLLKDYEAEKNKDGDLYHQVHELKIDSIDADKAGKKTAAETIARLEDERRVAIKNAPDMYRQYLRAMFDEWNKIVPDLKEQNEKFYQRMLSDFNRYG